MSELSENLVGLVEVVVSGLIEHTDDLNVSAEEAQDGSILITIRVHEDDAGKVIGRQGRIIKAIRVLARAASSNSTGVPVDVELVE